VTRLTFVRHAQRVANAGGVTMEHALILLSPLGVAQAACVAERRPAEPSKVLVSMRYARGWLPEFVTAIKER
jgi:broad specificity phosphatase PhoE